MTRSRIRKISQGVLSLAALLCPPAHVLACPACGPLPEPSGLEVHEWGTFTTLNSSAGNPLAGLYVDASRLPDFVFGLPYFNYDAEKGWASLDRLRNVTVKMETPVLYFYSRKEMAVDVKVEFKGGTISQWYPACYDCESNPAGPQVDFAQGTYPGHVGWKATVLAPGPDLPYTTPGATLEWLAPRATTANQLRGQHGEIEKFLFYRGLGNFPSTVDIHFMPDGLLRVRNGGAEDIGYLMVYERGYGTLEQPLNESSIGTVWYQGPMKAGQEMTFKRDKPFTDYMQANAAMDEFRLQMQKAGLTAEEARALLNTWYTGYFIEGGLKAFWILPRAQVDRILPLEITPKPDKLERVIVGRSEILTPEFEQVLYQAKASGGFEARFGKDKYRMAFLDFLAKDPDWHMGTGTRPASSATRGAGSAWHVPGQSGWASPWFPGMGREGAFDAQGRAIPGAAPSVR
ncbi:MAG: hypothetical protein JWP91_3392 [Fibrobacteres bacterium]|nr:hypothetical protein [Fibrobacterota bacterium]